MTGAPTVMVVEDDPSIRDLVLEVLRAEGYTVASAADGLCALDRLREMCPSAVVLDLAMPQVDGWQFLSSYQHLTGRPLPILVTSANMSCDVSQQLRRLGVQVCLAKPFDVIELLNRLAQVVADSSPPLQSEARKVHEEPRWAHLRELTAMVTRRLDASHALLIRAEDSLGWSQSRIQAYYSSLGLAFDNHSPDRRQPT